MIALGIDPGESTGAAVVLDMSTHPATARAALCWRTRKLKAGPMLDAWLWATQRVISAPDLTMLRQWIALFVSAGTRFDDVAVAVEGVRFQGMAQGDPVPRAAHAGRVAGWVEAMLQTDAARPYAQAWRKQVFGLSPRLDAKACDAAILRLLPALVTLPDGIPPWALKHLPDACGVALSLRTA